MKPNKVVFVDKELEESFNQMSDKSPVKKGIIKAIRQIKENFSCGRNVKKELIPKIFIDKYSIQDIEIIAAILDWMNHKDYERLFNF